MRASALACQNLQYKRPLFTRGFRPFSAIGPIPSELGQLANLQFIFLNGNHLEGDFFSYFDDHGHQMSNYQIHDVVPTRPRSNHLNLPRLTKGPEGAPLDGDGEMSCYSAESTQIFLQCLHK